MLKIATGEFQRNIGRYQDMALTKPVALTRNGRERTVLILSTSISALSGVTARFLAFPNFTEAGIAALEETRAPQSSEAFDHELLQ